jgi:hypothetical protein
MNNSVNLEHNINIFILTNEILILNVLKIL